MAVAVAAISLREQRLADGGTDQATINGNGSLDISGLTDGGMNIGSIAGSGSFLLGGNTLTVGGANLSTTVSGVISDGGANAGTGGSLAVTGTGTLTLTGQKTYTGATGAIRYGGAPCKLARPAPWDRFPVPAPCRSATAALSP